VRYGKQPYMLDHLAALADKMELLDYAISTHDGHAILESTLFLHVRCFQAACLPRSKLLIPALFIVFGRLHSEDAQVEPLCGCSEDATDCCRPPHMLDIVLAATKCEVPSSSHVHLTCVRIHMAVSSLLEAPLRV